MNDVGLTGKSSDGDSRRRTRIGLSLADDLTGVERIGGSQALALEQIVDVSRSARNEECF